MDNANLTVLLGFVATIYTVTIPIAFKYYQAKETRKTTKAEDLRSAKNEEIDTIKAACRSQVRRERQERKRAEARAAELDTRLRDCLERRLA